MTMGAPLDDFTQLGRGSARPAGMTRNFGSSLASYLLLSTLTLPACLTTDGGDAEEAGRPPSLTRSEMCTQTTCDRAREECHDDIEACENSCIGGSIESFNFF
jgi:hypothetical protein